ncbi:hypothetical protein GCM10011371_23210 [Novosphingobium marinum]|nr:hypothetical protein GCM10011371_23210 [Novosphingobium marinum]
MREGDGVEQIIEHGDYMPHGMCLLWEPWLLILWAGSDLLIFLSYTAIPLALLTVLRKRADVPHVGIVALFASFILFCGLTHLLGIVTLWYPVYPVVGVVKLITGLISVTTAVVLFRLVPALVAIPSRDALRQTNDRLRDEIAAHEATLASLERLVEERTRDLKSANATLAVQAREAVHRSSNLLAVVTSLAVQTAKGAQRTEEFLDAFLARIRALASATKSIERTNDTSIRLRTVIDECLGVLEGTYGQRFSREGPVMMVNPEAAQQISLALHELATNAQKYSLSASDAVRIDISWSVTDAVFELVWREHGGGRAAADGDGDTRAEGFGTKLLTRVVPTMLKGSASRTLGPDGLTYRLVAPLVAVTASDNVDDADRLAARIVDDTFGLSPT